MGTIPLTHRISAPHPIAGTRTIITKDKTDWDYFLQQLNDGDRDSFLQACRSGVYDGIDAIARTFDSVKVRRAAAAVAR